MTTITSQTENRLNKNHWIKTGLVTAAASVLTVLIVQLLAIAIWPDIALFKPLDSYPRTAVFTAVPVIGATVLMAWLATRRADPIKTFSRIALVVLILSIIPDYILPVSDKTFLASTVTAFMHLVAGAVTVTGLVTGYRRQATLTT